MTYRAGLMLLHLTMMASITSTDYTRTENVKIPLKCQERFKACGEFNPLVTPSGHLTCSVNAQRCHYTCKLTCLSPADGTRVVLENKRHTKLHYECVRGTWKRKETPQTFCLNKRTVPEVMQNFHQVNELNDLASALLNSSYFYLGMASFYERADVALPGFSKFMSDLWHSDLDQARDVMSYVNKRGGYIVLYNVPRPSSHELLLLKIASRPGLAGVRMALSVTRDIHKHVLALHKNAASDPHLMFYLDEGLLATKVEIIKKMADLESRLKAFSDEDYIIGEYTMDGELAK